MRPASADARADTETIALVRAHMLAALIAGACGAAIGALAYLQLLSPGILGASAWVGVGRLQFAYTLVMLFGWLGNAFFICAYVAFPGLARLVVRLRAGAWTFAGWNVAIAAPVVLMALAGILPPVRALAAWLVLSGPRPVMTAAGLFIVPSLLMTVMMIRGRVPRLLDRAFVMVAAGGLGMAIGLIGGPAAEARALGGGQPWLDAVAAMHPYWITAGVSDLIIFWGCVLGCVAILRRGHVAPVASTALSRAGFGVFILAIASWVVALRFTETLDASSTISTASEARGRAVFAREGCATCHGTGSQVGISPDLSRESGVRPADWHFAHLYSPRAVAPLSVMPSYAHLFNGAADRPTIAARDLVAYLDALGRARDLGAPEADAAAVHPPTSPARARRTGAVPVVSGAGSRADGLRLFGNYCAGCHGEKGEGDGPGAAGLRPKPANLAAHRYSSEQIATVLWNGVAGTAMPAWRDQPLDRIAALVAAVQHLGRQDVGRSNAGLTKQTGLPADQAGSDNSLGARVYAKHCVQCHGERGGGDGFSAASLPIAPADFQRQQPSLEYALRALAGGVEGTPMAPWTSRINEQELLAVAQYVRSLYTGGDR